MLAAPILTPINSKAKILLAGSKIYFNLQNVAQDASIQKAEVNIYLWRGSQIDVPATPAIVYLNLKKISNQDNYIQIEISSEVKSFITTAGNINKNYPQLAYNTTKQMSTIGEGVYVHIVYKVDNETDVQLPTYFATKGYRLQYEKKGTAYDSIIDVDTFRKYAKGIRYTSFNFNFDTTVANSQSGTGTNGVILSNNVNPSIRFAQTGINCLIIYLNRIGLWDYFTPFGKVVESLSVKKDSLNLSFRNSLAVNSSIEHLQEQNIGASTKKYVINTGLLDEKNNYQITEMLLSSKKYLLLFEEQTFDSVSVGLTVDSTLISVDNTNITVDTEIVTLADIGFYSNHKQIPIKLTTDGFTVKTRLNDKSSISYSLEFEEVNNFVSND